MSKASPVWLLVPALIGRGCPHLNVARGTLLVPRWSLRGAMLA